MAVITISRQLGSLGDDVALAIQKRLGYRIIGREIINQAALRARTPEVALATIDELGLLGLRPPLKIRMAYHEAVRGVMYEISNQGSSIIIGRAGQVILRDVPGVFHVKVIAPSLLRAERISTSQGITIECALQQVIASDQTRRNYLHRYYKARWDDPELYDLIVNTAHLTPDQAACIICQVIKQCDLEPSI